MGQIDSMLKSFTKIDDDLFEELEELLVMGDVGINTAQRICEELKARVKRDGVKDPNQIMGMLRNVVRKCWKEIPASIWQPSLPLFW